MQNEKDIHRFLYNQQQLIPKKRLFSVSANLLVSVIFNCRGGFAFLPIVFFSRSHANYCNAIFSFTPLSLYISQAFYIPGRRFNGRHQFKA